MWLVIRAEYLREVSPQTFPSTFSEGSGPVSGMGSHSYREELQNQQGSQTGECGNGVYVSLCTVALETGDNDAI